MCSRPAHESQDYVEGPIGLQILADTVPHCLDPALVSKLPYSRGVDLFNLRVLQCSSIHDPNAVNELNHVMVQLGIRERHFVQSRSSGIKTVSGCVHLADETWDDAI